MTCAIAAGAAQSNPMTPDSPLAEIPASADAQVVPEPPVEGTWRLREVFALAFLYFVALMLCAGFGLIVALKLPAFAGMKPEQVGSSPLFIVPVQGIAYLFGLGFAKIIVQSRTHKDFWEAIEWNWLPARDLGGIAAVGV